MNILTPSGYKNIEDVNIGDALIAYDINTGEVIINTLLSKDLWTIDMLPYNDPFYDLDGNLVCSGMTSEEVFQETYGDWKFYEINGIWKLFNNQSIWANMKVVHVSDLQVGDIIYDDNDNDVVITSIVECVEPSWWRLTVSGDHSYISENIQLHNASRFWSGNMTPTSYNWSYATGGTNWGSASGTADNATVPAATDDVTFDGVGVKGNANSIISAVITVLSLTITSGYTATMTHNAVLTIAGNITLGANYTIAGGSAIGSSASCTITSNGKILSNGFTTSNTTTKTLVGNLTITGQYAGGGATYVSTTTEELILSNIFVTSGNGSITGNVRIKGGTINITNSTLSGNIIFDGNITFVVCGLNGSITYSSGTITTTGSLLKLNANTTVNTNGMSWGIIQSSSITIVITLNSKLLFNSFIQIANSGSITFNGNYGFECNSFTINTSNTYTYSLILKNSIEYKINTDITCLYLPTSGAQSLITSDHATLKSILTLKNGATCNIRANFTRIDASGGRTINSWNGVITDCINIRPFTDLQTVAKATIN